MFHPIEDFHKYIAPGKRVHLAGIGGVSMCALAEVLQGMGVTVQGSDMTDSGTVKHLRSVGIPVAIGHSAENLKNCDAVIRTAAIHDSNPEIAGAVARGIPVYERAQAWGAIMQGYRNALCVSGTHGKTTTTSMNFFPTVAVILNVHADHLDFFKDLADIEHSFHDFAALVPQRGYVIANADDEGAREAVKGLDHPVFTFSVKDRGADCYADNVSFFDGYGDFDVVIGGVPYAHVSLHVPGGHNVSNALAAAAAAYVLGIPGEAVTTGLASFTGAGRRFEHKGTFRGAEVYDDYAHHPDEVQALLNAVRALPHRRLILAFQPHTYTRTAALFDDFVNVLRQADRVVLAEIYAARETNELGISSKDLAAQIPHAVYCPTLEQTADELEKLAQPGDMIITVGAGDIYRAGEMLLKRGDA